MTATHAPGSTFGIRPATTDDIEQITAIYNDAVETTTAIWNDTVVDQANRLAWWSERTAAGYPVLVAVAPDDSTVLGYATFGPWRAFDGYRHTVEHSVYVLAGRRGGGIGRALMEALVVAARERDLHVMVAGVEASNIASIRLHERLGFVRAGLLPEVGTKFDRWLDLVFLQLVLE